MELGNNKKVSRIQISNSILINDKLTHNGFGLYVVLKSMSYLNKNKRVTRFYLNSLKNITGWKDNRTIRRHLCNLEELKLIDKTPDRFNAKDVIEIEVFDLDMEKGFTQMDKCSVMNVINLTKCVKLPNRARNANMFGMAVRLFYYYEKNYNEKYGRAFPGYRKIRSDLGLSHQSIKGLNDFFHKNDIVIVVEGGYELVEGNYELLENKKRTNSYIPMCNRN